MTKRFLLFLSVLALNAMTFAADTPLNDPKSKAVLKVFNDWDQADVKKDTPTLAQILSADYIGIDEDGTVTSKADEIALIKKGEYIVESVEHLDPPKVRFYGSTAVVTSYAKVKQIYKGEASTVTARATTICVDKGADGWQVVSWHASKLKPD